MEGLVGVVAVPRPSSISTLVSRTVPRTVSGRSTTSLRTTISSCPGHALLGERLLVPLDNLDLALLRHAQIAGARNRAMLDLDPLVAYGHCLLDRALDDVALDPVTPLGGALANFQLLLDDRDDFLALAAHASPGGGANVGAACRGVVGSGRRGPEIGAGGRGRADSGSAGGEMLARHRVPIFLDIDRVQPGQYLHDAVVLSGSSTDHQDGMPTAEALGVEVSILIGQRVPLQGSQVIKVTAPVDQLHAGVIDAIADQRLARGCRPLGILEHGNDAVARPIFTIFGTRDALAVRRARGAGLLCGHRNAA